MGGCRITMLRRDHDARLSTGIGLDVLALLHRNGTIYTSSRGEGQVTVHFCLYVGFGHVCGHCISRGMFVQYLSNIRFLDSGVQLD